MHVLVVIDSLAPGGTEQSTVAMAVRLRDLGIETTIVTLKRAADGLEGIAQANGLTVLELTARGPLRQLPELRRIIRQLEPDVVHTALFGADQLGRLAAWHTGVPVLSSLVSTPYDAARLGDPNLQRWKLRVVQALDAATGLLMVSRYHAVSEGASSANARALRVPLDRVTVAERGRDISALGRPSAARRSKVRHSLGLADHVPVLLNLARQDHLKGHVDLIQATEFIAARHPSVVTLIAGKAGSATATIRATLRSHAITAERVRLLGHRTDVGDLLAGCDVLVIPSHLEGTAGVALEAMAMGVPVVSTNVEGLRGILRDGVNALLVPPAEPRSLAHAVERVLDDNDLAARLAEQGRRDFSERFTLDAAAQRMANLYRDVARSS